MEINLLVINAGNSRLAVGAFVAGEMQHVQRVSIDDQNAWKLAIEDAWSKIRGHENAAVAGASVNPDVDAAIEQVVKQVTDLPVEWAGKQIDLPMKVKTDSPEQTGVDRVLSLAAAYEQLGKGCIVVDAGTALTINCCNDKGEFVGGAIAPGFNTQLQAMHEKTAKLPQVAAAIPEGNFGTNTQQAMLHGVYHGLRGLVKEMAESFATELGTWPEVIATGGDAEVLFENWEIVHAISPDLILYGIALGYANHHIRHET